MGVTDTHVTCSPEFCLSLYNKWITDQGWCHLIRRAERHIIASNMRKAYFGGT